MLLTINRINYIIRLRELYYTTDTVKKTMDIVYVLHQGGRLGERCRMISFEEFILDDDSPIYMQIIRYIKQRIAAGSIGDQEEVPSRRALSALLGVNPNTIQKAYHMLEEEGIIASRSGAKSFTCVRADTVERIRWELTVSSTLQWVKTMKQLGVGREEAWELFEKMWEER